MSCARWGEVWSRCGVEELCRCHHGRAVRWRQQGKAVVPAGRPTGVHKGVGKVRSQNNVEPNQNAQNAVAEPDVRPRKDVNPWKRRGRRVGAAGVGRGGERGRRMSNQQSSGAAQRNGAGGGTVAR